MKRDFQLYILLGLFFLSVLAVIGTYIGNFHLSTISDSPADWGVLGDYFGGVLNPLISMITLFFLIKTYLTQKEELKQSESLNREQVRLSQVTVNTQLLNTKISAAHEALAVYHHEMDRVTTAKNNNWLFIGMNAKTYSDNNKMDEYRLDMAQNIQSELQKIDKLLSELDDKK